MTARANEPDCLDDRVCQWIWDLTDQAWIAETSQGSVTGLRILAIVAGALLVRWLARRAIRRMVRRAASGGVPMILKSLPERVRDGVQDAAGVDPARRRQRAEAIGSVLGNTATVVVFAVAALLVLGELDVNLAPLIAGAGIVGVALGFGAQSLVKDVLAGLFILMEDQYGIGDTVDLGEASGDVQAIGLRVTTLRDLRGVRWYVPNGEIRRVGNRSRGPVAVVVDLPIGFVPVGEASAALHLGAQRLAEDPAFTEALMGTPELLGVENVTVEGAVFRTIVATTAEAQWRVARELRRRQAAALEEAGLADQILAARVYPRDAGASGDRQ